MTNPYPPVPNPYPQPQAPDATVVDFQTEHDARRVLKSRMSLADFEATALEAIGSKPGLTLELNNGEEVRVPHPMLVTEERQQEIERVQSRRDLDVERDAEGNEVYLDIKDDDGNVVDRVIKRKDTIDGVDAPPFSTRLAVAILGREDYDRLRAGGGNANHVILAWNYLTDALKVDVNDPKLGS